MTAEKKNSFGEMLKFAITGGICFIVEFACLVVLKEVLHLDTLIATPIAFLVSVIANYILCVIWVFENAKGGGNSAKIGFLVTSLIGLLLNELLMLLFRHVFGEDQVLFTVMNHNVSMYMVNKVLATLLVMIWNYFTKKAVLQSDFLAKIAGKK